MISRQMEEYLEAISRLEERDEPVTTSALARECKVAAPTVTEMLQRLAALGLVHYEPHRGATLSEAGRRRGDAVLRRHRLWERFLHDALGVRWDRVHDQACELEHVTSPDLEQRIAQAVGESWTCPHGHPIPGAGGAATEGPTLPLTGLAPGQAARIVAIDGEEESLLRRLGALGLRPGVTVQAEEGEPEGAALALSVAGKQVTLGPDLASRVQAEVIPTPPSTAAPAVRLGDLAPGEVAAIAGFRAGRGLVGRCLALGFTPGVEVRMVQNVYRGPVIVLVRDTRIALGRGEANRIMVIRKEGAQDESGPLL